MSQETQGTGRTSTSMHRLKNAATEATHPIVRVHPETGRKSLYLSPAFTTRFEGMTVRESKPLIDFLYDHATQSQFGCRLHWQAGSLALWDNRVSLHHAVVPQSLSLIHI